MADPFAPKPCKECGTELPYKVHEAGSFLYDGGSIEVSSLADKIAEYMQSEPKRRARGEAPFDDKTLAEQAISKMLDWIRPEHFAAAVRHWGDLGHEDGSACERTVQAKWCHEPAPNHGGFDDPRPFECTLEAGHEGEHVFEYQPAGASS